MTSREIRQSFLDFFRSKQHTIVPSSSLMPDSPNLLFTNAGMNQFVPIFLAERTADVSRWANVIPSLDTRAADTQKCIRAGGKHNDLDDVGLDTYHHTFFEMLGNWSFGDYFKKEAIDWAWELIVETWKFPPQRIYATVYKPDPSKGDPSSFDQEAWDLWATKFQAVGLDPAVHIVNGNKKDNFWMMGETGPCGPCSELHVDLTPAGDTRGALVNRGTAECIEIWNLVFIQFNANPDGTFSSLPARHVDTGMGFERVTSIIQGTKNFTDFANARISNYETDIFRPIFDELEKLSGLRYGSTLPQRNAAGQIAPANRQEEIDVAFRVISDHIRTLSFAVADGIQPGNSDRHYVLRRILRRAIRYGRSLGLKDPFFYKLVDVLAATFGDVFPEIRSRQAHVKSVLRGEEESFNQTLDRGLELFQTEATRLAEENPGRPQQLSGAFAFQLYDTHGFPLDLTELMARERGGTVDTAEFDRLMDEQRQRARASQKRQVIELSQIETKLPTRFVGYHVLETSATVLEVVALKDKIAVVLDASPCYAEMGGQVGDSGELSRGSEIWQVQNTQKSGHTWLHLLDGSDAPAVGQEVRLTVHPHRRHAIERHHTVTHLLHWALHEIVGRDLAQKGSFVGPDKLTFDFNSQALTPSQLADVERLVNERVVENAAVTATEAPYAEIRGRRDVMQLFGEKYGEIVRVVQIGGQTAQINGYSNELCGGTHTRATGEIGLFRILSESAIQAGVRRIEAVAGLAAYAISHHESEQLRTLASKLGSPIADAERKLDALFAHQKELEKALKAAQQREAAQTAKSLLPRAQTLGAIPALIAQVPNADGDTLQSIADALKSEFNGVVVLGGAFQNAVSLIATVSPQFTAQFQAGKIIQSIAPIVGGKGGGKPDNARGGGKDVSKLEAALAKARELFGA